jgi:hypothetical protein
MQTSQTTGQGSSVAKVAESEAEIHGSRRGSIPLGIALLLGQVKRASDGAPRALQEPILANHCLSLVPDTLTPEIRLDR